MILLIFLTQRTYDVGLATPATLDLRHLRHWTCDTRDIGLATPATLDLRQASC